MELHLVYLLIFMNFLATHAKHEKAIKNLLRILRRTDDYPREDTPNDPEDLPEAEPIHPGHTLIKPTLNMLRSQIKFPLRDLSALVYGNLDNLDITYGKSPYRVLNTSFRKMNNMDFLKTLLNTIQAVARSRRNHGPLPTTVYQGPIVLPRDLHAVILKQKFRADSSREMDNENRGEEIFDFSQEINDHTSFRRKTHCFNSSELSSATDSSSESDFEKNSGNPYTVRKGKYFANWIWNDEFDGLHMNLSPYAPKFPSMGPAGTDLFFNRKWWYFNQDDYKPLG